MSRLLPDEKPAPTRKKSKMGWGRELRSILDGGGGGGWGGPGGVGGGGGWKVHGGDAVTLLIHLMTPLQSPVVQLPSSET